MSKYDPLWRYIEKCETPSVKLSFQEIQTVAGIEIDHSFLRYKQELTAYGWQVDKISLKAQTVTFKKITIE